MAELDPLVPRALADSLCSGDCAVTAEFSALDPDAFERKYCARDVGLFLSVKPDEQEVVQLVGCNFNPRCSRLPAP